MIPSRKALEGRVAALCWQDEGGGYSFTESDVLGMDLDKMDRYIRIAYNRRKARQDAIKKSNTTKTKGRRRS